MWRREAEYLGCGGPQPVLSHTFSFFTKPREVGIVPPITSSAPEAQRLLTCQQGSFKPQPRSARSWSPVVGRRGVRQVRHRQAQGEMNI